MKRTLKKILFHRCEPFTQATPSSLPKKTLSRYTLRVAKEDTKIDYVGDWTSFNYRKAMQDAGYKNGDQLGGIMFPQLWPRNT